MEKSFTSSPRASSVTNRLSGAAVLAFLGYVYYGLGLSWFQSRLAPSYLSNPPLHEQDRISFSWTKINPEPHLNYTSCFGRFDCARLSVPMDWNSTDPDSPKVNIAVMKFAAPVPVTDPRYGGAILINPGGPGGSGVHLLHRTAAEMSILVSGSLDASHAGIKYYDYISWDPRGVNNTTPRLNCFSDASSSDNWNLQNEANGIDSNSSAAVSNIWARSKALADGCSVGSDILRHMNTAPVVADMVAIIEGHGEWRSHQAEAWLSSCEGRAMMRDKTSDALYSPEAVLERTRWIKGEEKLNFWGFSYGTLIGSTFATLQPHRVGRVVIDGVCDTTDYYNAGWLSNLQDTDQVMEHFYEYCSLAGPSKCAMNLGNTSAATIKSQVEALVPRLREDPIAVSATETQGPQIITYSDMMQMVRQKLYKPMTGFPIMAELLADLVNGNGSAFATHKQELHKPSCPLNGCPNPNAEIEPCVQATAWETTAAIMCSDAVDVSNGTKTDFKTMITTLVGQSKWFGEAWSTIAVQCLHWKTKASWTLAPSDVGSVTANPILMVGNTWDTVTPLRNAVTMSKMFPGSVVLEQRSDGHCSSAAPSICSATHIRAYFQTGVLPEEGTVCEVDEVPLVGKVGEERLLLVGDAEMLDAMMRLGRVVGDGIFNAPI